MRCRSRRLAGRRAWPRLLTSIKSDKTVDIGRIATTMADSLTITELAGTVGMTRAQHPGLPVAGPGALAADPGPHGPLRRRPRRPAGADRVAAAGGLHAGRDQAADRHARQLCRRSWPTGAAASATSTSDIVTTVPVPVETHPRAARRAAGAARRPDRDRAGLAAGRRAGHPHHAHGHRPHAGRTGPAAGPARPADARRGRSRPARSARPSAHHVEQQDGDDRRLGRPRQGRRPAVGGRVRDRLPRRREPASPSRH